MKALFNGIKGLKVLENETLSAYTSFHIGGKARYLLKVYKQPALFEAMTIIKKRKLKYCVLGAGTNLLFGDKGFAGAVIKLLGEFQRIEGQKGIFSCGSGVLIKDLIKKAMEEGYGGIEFLSGIPGTIGGAVKGNAGAFGKAIADVLLSITVLDPKLRIKKIPRDELKFAYRSSSIPEGYIILGADFKLRKMDKRMIAAKVSEILKIRRQRQPRGFSAGSFFKNPLPLSAGKLIEECGLKGLRIGGAMVSKKHANFIMNVGNARAEDVLRLMRIIKRKVKLLKGVELEPEVRIIK
ncbi:MAG: UDP-N-acetylmuramate dehydrogenase [candidate division WOR-3 bacterium]